MDGGLLGAILILAGLSRSGASDLESSAPEESFIGRELLPLDRSPETTTPPGLPAVDRFSRSGQGKHAKRERNRSELDLVSVGDRRTPLDLLPAHERSVLASKVLDEHRFSGDHDPGVAARHAGMVEEDVHIGIASQHALSLLESELAGAPIEPVSECRGTGPFSDGRFG